MSELAERAKAVVNEIRKVSIQIHDGETIDEASAQFTAAYSQLIEQALLAERKSVWEEAAKIADGVIAEAGQQSDDDYWSPGGGRANITGASEVVARLRAAAEKEVGK